VIIVLGGDDISEYYGILRFLDILLRLKYLKKEGRKLYLLGQSIGPVHAWRIPVARSIIAQVDRIYHRGPHSYNFVTETLRAKHNSFLSADLAFLDLARQNIDFDLSPYDLKPGEYITYVPSGIWSKYSNEYGLYFDGLIKITEFLIEKCQELNMTLVLLPHVLRASDDRAVVKELMAATGNGCAVAINDVLLPCEARALLSSSYFVVTHRMHAAISSFQTGVPALSISYSVKYSDVIGNYLGLPELVVNAGKADFVRDTEKIISAITSALQHLSILRARVRTAARNAKKDALIQIEHLVKDIVA
jgi:colanic acid/amylovoran biosynthesis protein